jgi:hypothetical protein
VDARHCAAVASLLTGPLAWRHADLASPDEERKVQMGCVDVLGMLVQAELLACAAAAKPEPAPESAASHLEGVGEVDAADASEHRSRTVRSRALRELDESPGVLPGGSEPAAPAWEIHIAAPAAAAAKPRIQLLAGVRKR